MNVRNRKTAGTVAFVILISATIALVVFLFGNQNTRVGPPYQVITGSGGGSGGLLLIKDEDTPTAPESYLNFIGPYVSCASDAIDSVDCTFQTPTPIPAVPTATPQPTAITEKYFTWSQVTPTDSEDDAIWSAITGALTIDSEECVLIGSSTPSVTVTLRHSTDRSATGNELNTGGNAITSVTSGDTDTSFDDATVPVNSWIWVETTAQSGTVDEINCTWRFTWD